MSKWFQIYRLNWIKSRLFEFNCINLKHIQETFDVSHATASGDMNKLMKSAPDLLVYNKSTKQFELLANKRDRILL